MRNPEQVAGYADKLMSEIFKTAFHDRHVTLGAKIVEFGGWDMPIQYPTGIVAEHLATRKQAGLFDVSHMGRFILRGSGGLAFLQHVLTNNTAALEVGQAQYTMIPNASGGAVDDAYLYRFVEDEYLLVVNAANRKKDWDHFQSMRGKFADVELTDESDKIVMLSLQGPRSKEILLGMIESGRLPEPKRNELSIVAINGCRVMLARTGYTGEPLGFELFIETADAPAIWDILIEKGAVPIGLGARDTLRLEAGLPLYGHELGIDPDGREIPIFACPLAKFAVSFSQLKGDFVGKAKLQKQFEAFERITFGDSSDVSNLPRIILSLAIAERAIARPGAKVFAGDRHVGYVTSGTMVPYWQVEGKSLAGKLTDDSQMRAICLALLDSNLREGDKVSIEIRAKQVEAAVVPFNLRSEAAPYARSILLKSDADEQALAPAATATKVSKLLDDAIANTSWRQQECINLIPSEQTASPMVRLLSVMDPAFRYAEHKEVKAFDDAEVFYYQGTDFISNVEQSLEDEMKAYMGCRDVETRVISGQMANAAVFSAMIDYLNRASRKVEPRRIRKVMNNSIIKGGHLSSQPMGALKDFVARDPLTEMPAAVNFPVMADNPYKIDVVACMELIERHKPELMILGRSAVLHGEPVAELKAFVQEAGIDCVIMYDMAHVLGLLGPHFQEPFKDGADIVTGSTHKTFFGTQRGVIGGNFQEHEVRHKLWDAVKRRVFPGAVSNHHLGTLLGLLMAAYEMNHFKAVYQPAVLANAKAFAKALKACGLDVAGDPAVDYTETHQVIVNVGYAKGSDLAKALEDNNIIVNYQAGPYDEGFSASGAIRLGVSEMTRFGMTSGDFETVAQFIKDVADGKSVIDKVKSFRSGFTELGFCFTGNEYDIAMQKLHSLI